ncbi:Scr1 family TA system antitoxin-like transcriptional regulator [Streptomyces sp. NPDC059080]|uniref:Scr1 family TA system antitoxin-like transcriptional regulator n=1 Tax=Streptomyces sp. NPDC059080 TaxID=3346718 RepID=UPI0036BFF9AB
MHVPVPTVDGAPHPRRIVAAVTRHPGLVNTFETAPSAEFWDAAPGWYDRLATCIHAATRIRTYDATRVPSVLRTPAYSAGLTWVPEATRGACAVSLDRVDRVMALIDWSVLLGPVTGSEMMAEQMDHLLAAADHGAQVRIVPFGAPPVHRGDRTAELHVDGHRLIAIEGYDIPVRYLTGETADRAAAEILDAPQAACSEAESRHLIEAVAAYYRDPSVCAAYARGDVPMVPDPITRCAPIPSF